MNITLVGDVGPLAICFGALVVLLAHLAGRELQRVWVVAIGDLGSLLASASWFVATLCGSRATNIPANASFTTVLGAACGFATVLLSIAAVPGFVAAFQPDDSDWEMLSLGTTVATGVGALAIVVPLLLAGLIYH